MDIAAIIFLIFGWVFGITALKVTALAMSSVFSVLIFLAMVKGAKLDHYTARFTEQMIILALSIVSILL